MTSSTQGPTAPKACLAGAQPAGPCRRGILRGAAGLGVLGLTGAALSGCGGTAAEAVPAAPSGGGPGVPAALGPATQIPVGGGKIFDKDKVVVTQPTKGIFKAFTAVCTHTGCIVSEVDEGTINCPCHGSRYSITDGSVVAPPAPAPLAAKTVTVVDGNLSVAL